MKKDRLLSINVRRVLDRIINDSQVISEMRAFDYDDIKGALLRETDAVESRITEALRILVSEGILRDKSTLLGRPPRYLGSKDGKRKKNETTGRKPNYYQIIQNKEALKEIFYIYLNEDVEKFLKSLYVNSIIKKLGSSAVYDVIKPCLERSKFRRIATRSLLIQPAFIDEYRDKSILISEFFSVYGESKSGDQHERYDNSEIEAELVNLIIEKPRLESWEDPLVKATNVGCRIKPIWSNRIRVLEQLYPGETVSFYRKTIHEGIGDLFSKIYEHGFITQSATQFIKYDNYLSPFTSYPINDPIMLLFAFPFKRVFDDVYLLDKTDLSKLNQRAFILYKNFGDILFEYFRNHMWLINKLDQYIRQFIFQWNVTKSNFDAAWFYLSNVYREGVGSGSYHVYVDGMEIIAKDLKNGSILEPFEMKMILHNPVTGCKEEMSGEEIRPPIIDQMFAGRETDVYDPYTKLISSDSFRGGIKGCPTSIPYDQILSDLKARFAEYGCDYDEVIEKFY